MGQIKNHKEEEEETREIPPKNIHEYTLPLASAGGQKEVLMMEIRGEHLTSSAKKACVLFKKNCIHIFGLLLLAKNLCFSGKLLSKSSSSSEPSVTEADTGYRAHIFRNIKIPLRLEAAGGKRFQRIMWPSQNHHTLIPSPPGGKIYDSTLFRGKF